MKTTIFASAVLVLSVSAAAQQVQTFAGTEERQVSRVGYYTQTDAGFQMLGGVSVDFGMPEWKKAYEKEGFLDQFVGQRWRFGSGVWTSLDTNLPLTIGDTQVAPGAYYLALEYTADKKMHLILLDAQKMREKKMDAGGAQETTGGMAIPMDWKKVDDVADRFTIALEQSEDDPKQVTMVVRWGNHKLWCKMHCKVGDGA